MNEIIKDLKDILKANPWRIENELRAYVAKLETLPKDNTPKLKTDKQRSALHLGLNWLANHLNEIGKDMRVVLKPTVSIPWTTLTAKEYLYKPILKGYADKKSTEEMTKPEVGEVWDIMMKFLGENHGVEYIPFPSKTVIDEKSDAIAMSKENAVDYPINNLEDKL